MHILIQNCSCGASKSIHRFAFDVCIAGSAICPVCLGRIDGVFEDDGTLFVCDEEEIREENELLAV